RFRARSEALRFLGFPVVAFAIGRHYKTRSDLGPSGFRPRRSLYRRRARDRRLLFAPVAEPDRAVRSFLNTRAGECPERQRGRTVNPLRKLRRFESCFPHHALFGNREDGAKADEGDGAAVIAGIAQW